MNKIIAITPGEPSGIGPDITLKCLSKKINSRIFVIYDIEHLRYRAKKLNLNFKFKEINIYEDIKKCDGKVIYCQNVNLVSPVKIGIPCKNNSSFVKFMYPPPSSYSFFTKNVGIVVPAPI